MPDPLAHLLDEIDAAAAGMPQGKYRSFWTGTGDWRGKDFRSFCVASEEHRLEDEHHAAYFAKLDPRLVQALVAVVKAEHDRYNLEATTDPSHFPQNSPEWHEAVQAYGESRAGLFVAWQRLRAIAAERAGAGE